MDLTTRYLGLELSHPVLPGASPLSEDTDMVRRLVDAGAPAIVMSSLFEEQMLAEEAAAWRHAESHDFAFGEAQTFFPGNAIPALGPDEYLRRIERLKAAVRVPVIASLNGVSLGGWLECARRMQEAGADALELNVYSLPTDPAESSSAVENHILELVSTVREAVKIPLAVKLGPFYTGFAHFARRLDTHGADALVLFNRLYQPEIDLEALEVRRNLHLSDSSELPLRLRWIALLSGEVRASLAVTGGVHGVEDVVRAVMAGAHAVQTVSSLLLHGPAHLTTLRDGLGAWLAEHGYESLRQAQGSLSARRCPDPDAYGRGSYMLMLKSWRPPAGSAQRGP